MQTAVQSSMGLIDYVLSISSHLPDHNLVSGGRLQILPIHCQQSDHSAASDLVVAGYPFAGPLFRILYLSHHLENQLRPTIQLLPPSNTE
jgi:hypothetical protein